MKKKKNLDPLVATYSIWLLLLSDNISEDMASPFLEADSPLLGGGGGRRAQRPPPEHRQGIRQNLDHSFLTHEDIEEG